MTRQLTAALRRQKKQTQQEILKIPGSLGITIGGQKRVEVPNRNSFVYVRLRDNQNELIQAFNNKVAPSYGLPVIVERQGNRYIVTSVDSLRYNNNYNSFAPFLPRHGSTHSFDFESGGAGDPVWVYSRQMMPALIMPSGSDGGPNAILNAYTLKNADGTWKYVGVTGTPNITQYKPTNNQAVMVLVYLDSLSGNPYLMVGSGSYFANTITGSAAIVPYIPTLVDPNHIPLAAVRLVSGTNALSWNNIYDVRQWLHPIPSGTSSGGGGGTGTSIAIWDEGIVQGNVTTINFTGQNIHATVSGSVANVSQFLGGASGSVAVYDSFGELTYRPWLHYGDVAATGYLEFGADQVKETNAGRIGYGIFGVGYLYIVGAGTDPSDRRVQIYDKLYVSDLVQASSFNITNPAQTYNITGSPHQHTGLTAAENNANDIFRVNSPGGSSAFVGTINGSPSGASVVYNVSSGNEGAMVPNSTSQLAKIRLYNTTRGNSALISNCNVGTNTITLTASVPVDWVNGDTITIASQTVSGGGASWIDVEITSGPTGKASLFADLYINSTTVGDIALVHPTESYSASKQSPTVSQVTNQLLNTLKLIKITNNLFSMAWIGTPTYVILREMGYVS